jgi:transposase-like protein
LFGSSFESGVHRKETHRRKSRFTEEQIFAILAEHERGVPTADVCRKYGISGTTFYK